MLKELQMRCDSAKLVWITSVKGVLYFSIRIPLKKTNFLGGCFYSLRHTNSLHSTKLIALSNASTRISIKTIATACMGLGGGMPFIFGSKESDEYYENSY